MTVVQSTVAAAGADRSAAPGSQRWLAYGDPMRVLGVLAVLWVHVCDMILFSDKVGQTAWWVANFADAAGRWAVPVFIMLSGALLLHTNREQTPAEFYKRRLTRLGAAIAFWSVFFMLFAVYYTGWASGAWNPALRGTTSWIIVGADDGSYTEGSRRMAKALADKKCDVILTEVPGVGHGPWGAYYASRKFYEVLLMHRCGQPRTGNRPSAQELVRIAYTPPASVDAKLAEPLRQFLPWWQILNCGPDLDPGLKEEWGGRKKVFATHPLDRGTPCRFLTTLKIPAGKKSALLLTVGHHPEGQWQLIVRGDGKDLYTGMVNKDTAKGGWLDVKVDLSAYAGKDLRVELLNQAVDWQNVAGYWARVELVSE